VSASALAKVDELIDLVFSGVKAVMISMMQDGLKKSRRFLVDLIAARDTDRDGYLQYREFEDMLLQDIQVSFFPKLFESIIIGELMDPAKRQGKIKNDIIKVYMGEGDAPGAMADLVPTQESRRARKGAA